TGAPAGPLSMRPSFGALQLFLWTFGSTLTLISGFQVIEALWPGSSSDLVTLGAVEALVYGSTVFLVWHVYANQRPIPVVLGLRRSHPMLPALGLGLGGTLQAPVDTLQYVVEWLFGPASEEQVLSRSLMLRAETELEAAMMMLSVAFLVPLVEELLFRGAFFGALRARMSAPMAALLTGASFVVCHVQPRIWLPLMAVAAVLSMLRVVSGSVLPGFALHLGFNAVTLALVVLRLVPVDRLGLSWQLSLLGWALTFGLLYAVMRV